ncbi:PF09365 family protein [Leptospira broomii serovar Hurstbridge str. 5399]|uniref:PF09365 family protein n=1 Tax=Leptospira broomii serovar Hurstbridge str. 5399 TaxID=1049789 RepID=T0G9K1_9LEPT|nr:DUF2461 domain-containing protein [Leptospira broomii]EQA43499.1 PF09365 family protein [Leptospira broomii serovar Hurstbridge str. 5399]
MHKQVLDFLKNLSKNNNRDWFKKNEIIYRSSLNEFYEFVEDLILGIQTFDPSIRNRSAKECVFRIYKDVRFSKDKSPYKTNFGAWIGTAGKKEASAGYYIHVAPGESMVAGGLYLPPSPALLSVRNAIASDSKELRSIIGAKSFKNQFKELEGERLNSAPKGFSKDHPDIDLLRLKSFIAIRKFSDKEVLDDHFVKLCLKSFEQMLPLNRFLNKAIKL